MSFLLVSIGGTTSACAENTPCSTSAGSGMWNYLRVRGEYANFFRLVFSVLELPPRARRIPVLTRPHSSNKGNYLRVRGEYTPSDFTQW